MNVRAKENDKILPLKVICGVMSLFVYVSGIGKSDGVGVPGVVTGMIADMRCPNKQKSGLGD